MNYNRKIFYMGFYEDNEKKGNAGYIKVLERENIVEAEVCLSGASTVFDGERELEIYYGGSAIAKEKLVLQKGGGTGKYGWERRGELSGLSFVVQLSAGCCLDSGGRRQAPQREQVRVAKEAAAPYPAMMEEPERFSMTQAEESHGKPEWEPVTQAGESLGKPEWESVTKAEESHGKPEWEPVTRAGSSIRRLEPHPMRYARKPAGIPEPQLEIMEDNAAPMQEAPAAETPQKEKVENRKWKQISKVYPHINPFQDFREYIKLDLKDMVLLSEKKYSLVENSFLLHGYYNYGHIILWRKEKTPMKYYIGVPGNFYEKEKQVAILYGFESFEGAVEPAKEGDFGYYMTEVTI